MDIKEIINNNVIIITGGIGTTLIYKYNIQLQDFSSIHLLKDYKKK
jgi:methionine synthase I (cobalamin-dependent)